MFDFESYELWKIIEELAKQTGNYNLILRSSHACAMSRVNTAAKHKELVNEIVNEVLSRLSVSADVENAVKQIESLNTAINALGNK